MADLIAMLSAAAGVDGGAAADPFFNQTTLLLHGDGTNGAQNNTFLDSSTNNFTITRNGNTTQGTFSPFSVAAGEFSNYFDGSGDYLSISDSTAFNMGSGDFTAECWIYTTNASATSTFITTAETTDFQGFFLGMYGGSFTFLADGDGSTPWTVDIYGGTVVANAWTHVAGVRNGNVFTLYVNGVSIGSSTQSITLGNSNNKIVVGGRTASSGQYLPGYLSNARVVKGTAVYTSAFTPSTSPLTAISGTELLTCQSNRFVDNSSNAFAITVNGNTSVQPFSPFAPSAAYSTSVNGGSGYFDGSGDSLSVPDDVDLDFGAGDYTIECWLYRNNTTDDMAIMDGRSGISTGYLIALATGNKILWFVNATLITGSTTIGSGTWYHIAITRSGTSVKLFVNGAEDGSATDSTSTDSGAISIGSKSAGASASSIVNFNGYIANIRIVKGTAVYTSAFTPPTAPPTAIANTSLLCNFTNAGILDNTGKNNLETVADAQIDTSVKKYGTGSIEFDGTGDYLKISSSLENYAFGSGDFTIEIWGYLNNLSDNRQFYESYTGDAAGRLSIYVDTSGVVQVRGSGGATKTSGGTVSTSTWTHIAITRASGSMRIFLDGVQVNTTFTDTAVYTASEPILIGVNGFQVPTFWRWNGYIDDYRITKGVARYTAAFTPPTEAFPDF